MADKMMRISGRDSEGKARAIKTNSEGQVEVSPLKRNIEISRKENHLMAGGEFLNVILNIDTAPYIMVYVKIKSDTAHNFKFSTQFKERIPPLSKGDLVPWEISGGSGGENFIRSEWLEVFGERLDIAIKNEDTIEHSYDIVVCGVR